ncbi:MAG: hypothetical protein ACOX4D_01035 [Bacteroidales bacterium]|jgi:hypothetical protein
MKRFILFYTTLILLPLALQAQVTDPNDDSGFILDSVKLEKGVLTRYGRYNGKYCLRLSNIKAPVIKAIRKKS